MRNFYLEYQICQTVSGKLTWSHYCELLGIADKNEREFYQNECVNSLWSVRELNRQIETRLFERILLSELIQERLFMLGWDCWLRQKQWKAEKWKTAKR